MAARITTAAIDAALDAALGGATRLSLHTGDPGATGTSNELTSGTAPGYARGVISFDAAAAASKPSHAAVDFVADGGDWPQVTHVGVWAGSTFVCSGPLAAARQIANGQTLHVAAAGVALSGAAA